MFWLILLGSSTWLGFEIFPLVVIDNYSLSFRIMNGWIIGSLISGLTTFIFNFFISVNWFNSLCCIILQVSLSYYLRKKKRSYYKNDLFEIHSWGLFFMIFITGLALKYLSLIYSSMPTSVPYIFRPILDDELSFITHVMNFRRSNLFYYEESRLSDFYYKGYSFPLLYTASLMSLGASYSDATIIICLFNIIALSFIILINSELYSKWYLVSCFLFYFSAPSAFHYFFKDKNRLNIQNDLVHQIEPNHHTIAYQTFFCMLSCSKMASYTITLTQYSYYHRSGFLTLFIPNIPAQLGTFLTLFVERKSNWPKIWPIILIIIPHLFPFNFSYFPLFREETMRGTLFAAFKIWYDSFSLMPLSLFYKSSVHEEFRKEMISRLAGFCLIIFLREGNDRFINFAAAVALIGPTINLLFSISLKIILSRIKSEEIQGCFLYVHWAIFFTFIAGGFICASRILMANEKFIGKSEIQLINWINSKDKNNKFNVPTDAVLFVKPRLLHPAILAKRRLFIGDKRSLYLYGYKITKKFLVYKDVVKSNFSSSVLQKYHINYVIDDSSNSFFFNEKVVEKNVVFSNQDYRVLKF